MKAIMNPFPFGATKYVVKLVQVGNDYAELVPPPLPTEPPPDAPPRRSLCGHPTHKQRAVWQWNVGIVVPTMRPGEVMVQWMLAVHFEPTDECGYPGYP